ncbi:MAG: hypothetical protein PHU04_05650, partial [Candidatus Peribacteraceae bacterium]|nr:hypothetical protein [Candidatus Peribacteraceae bacterium]
MNEYTIVFLTLLAGTGVGILAGYFWFSKGKKISMKLQTEIREQEIELKNLESTLRERQHEIKTTESEARALAKEITTDAKLKAQEMESKLEAEQARLEEKEKGLDQKVKEVERQRDAVHKQQEEASELKAQLADAAQQHRTALETVAKLSQEEAMKKLTEELEHEFAEHFAQQIRLQKE